MSVTLQQRAVERRMLDAISEAVVASDELERVVYCNRAAEALYGQPAEEMIGRPIRDVVAPTIARAEEQEIRRAVLEDRTWSGILTGHRADGTTFPHQVTLSPLRDELGAVAGMIGVGRDISEDMAARARERETDERFRRVFDQSPVAMAVVGLDLRLQQANAALERLLGYTCDELVGRTLESVTHPDDVQEDLEGVRRLIEGDAPTQQIQKRFIRADGEIVVGRVTGTLVHDEDGAALYGIGTIEDLTATLGAFNTIQAQKERMATTLEAAGVATWDLDFATMRQTVSDNYADLLGLPFDEVPETFDEVVALVHPDDQALFLDPTPDPEAAGDRFDVEFRMVRPRGGIVWISCKGSFVRDDDGEATGLRGTMVNLTEQRAVEIRRVEAEARYRQTIEAANDAFVGIDDDGRLCEWNAAAERMFGWAADEIIGRPLIEVLVPEDRRARYREGLEGWRESLAAGEPLPDRWEMNARHRDGRAFPVEASIMATAGGPGGGIRAFVRDITARREHERRLAELAVTDTLTGLPNRTVLLEHVARGIALLEAGTGAAAVIFIDLDRFKDVNDRHGHEAGDEVLAAVAKRLRGAVRPTDIVARIGGDEFAVACSDLSDVEDARHVAERILVALEAPVVAGPAWHTVGVSIGIATLTEPTLDAEALLRDADQAMYRAKRSGGACYAMDEA